MDCFPAMTTTSLTERVLPNTRKPNLFPLVVFFLLLVQAPVSRTIPIDNGVEDTTVSCSQDSIMVSFKTRNPFTGRIFVKGMSDNVNCVENFNQGGAVSTNPEMTFSFGGCNMQRSRTLSPQKGMMQSIVVIISFHRIFITKVDKAYKVQCFYMEAEKTVTSQLEVSMITTQSLEDSGRMPTCEYSVRRGSKDGEVVKFARIGEPVFHEWECDSENHRILVKNCFVDDGQGNKYEILDDKGCAIDPVILSNLEYESSGMAKAWVEAHVFKFADRPTVFFQCTIQICNRGEATCDALSPPQCDPLRLPVESVSTQQEFPTTTYTEYYSSDAGATTPLGGGISSDFQLDSSPQSINQPAIDERLSTDLSVNAVSDETRFTSDGQPTFSDFVDNNVSGGTAASPSTENSETTPGGTETTSITGNTGPSSTDSSSSQTGGLSTSSNDAADGGDSSGATSASIGESTQSQIASDSSSSSSSSFNTASSQSSVTLLDSSAVSVNSSSTQESFSNSPTSTAADSESSPTSNGSLPLTPGTGGATQSRTSGPAPRFRYRYHRSVQVGDIGNLQQEPPIPPSYHEVDLFSNSISVMDLDESADGREEENEAYNRLLNRPFGQVLNHIDDGICMSSVGFGIMLSLVILVFMIAIVVAILLCYGKARTDYKA